MASSLEECVQRDHVFGIVDEVDNILIDEARTPLIISGRPEQAADTYGTFARLAKQMVGEEAVTKLKSLGESRDTSEAEHDFEYDEKHKTVAPTEAGVHKAEKFLGVENLYTSENGTLVNHLIQCLKAEKLYSKDTDYAVIDGQVMIIDEFTGRILEGRRWSEGLHQAIEAKEGVRVREENQTLATITLQNYFRLYEKLSGMTGTALTEAQEFMKIYEMPVVEIPTHRPMVRDDANDQIYKTKAGKWKALVNEIKERNEKGQPILIGTISVEVSEMLGAEFKRNGIDHVVLNAKPEHAQREGETISQAGRLGAVTIATNMAGRGVDIKLGGDPDAMAQAAARKQGLNPGDEGWDDAVAIELPALKEQMRSGGRQGPRARRPLHLRHRAPRVAADRQPASRPLRPPGRPRRVALLPLGRGRPRPPLRGRPHLQDPRPPGTRRRARRGVPARGEDAHEADRGRPEEGRAAELPDQKARPRVRRRDERAAPRHLQVPPRDPRGPRHVGGRARRSRRRARAPRAGVHDRRRLRGMGHRRAPLAGGVDLAARGRPRQRSIRQTSTREEIGGMLSDDILSAYSARAEEFGHELMGWLERQVLLQIIDNRWREHLYEMDYLREGIHLRGFAQIDPLVAYKNEGFMMFEELMASIWQEFARMIFHVEVNVEPKQREEIEARRAAPQDVNYSGGTEEGQPSALREAAAQAQAAPAATTAAPVRPATPESVTSGNGENPTTVVKSENEKLGRNDPCWCGSGKKFKNCHGG